MLIGRLDTDELYVVECDEYNGLGLMFVDRYLETFGEVYYGEPYLYIWK